MDTGCNPGECENDPKYTEPYVAPALPDPDDCGGGGGGGEGHKYTFRGTATGWQVLEDGRVIYNYTDKDTNTTYEWQATTEGWVVKDNTGKVVFTYTDKSGENTTYNFEQTDDCGIKVTDNTGKVVFEYTNDCAGTTYTFEQTGVDFKVTNDKTGQVVFTYKGTVDTNTTYTWENYKDGFKVTDSDGVVAYIYDPELGKMSDGSYGIDTLLTTVFKGHTTISVGQIIGFNPADLVVGETLVYDGVGSVGVITADNGDGTYQVTTMTTSPGSRQGVRLGSVNTVADLPATCAAAEAMGWQTPQLGDFAYVTTGGAGDVVSEYVITTDTDCNLTWTFSHSFNAGDYQEQSTTSMSGMILTGGAVQGTFGTPIDPTTLIRGVMRNGILLTPDAQGKVNVIVDDSHIIVNALPTTGIVDKAEYVVIDANQKVTGTWVHDNTGWYQTYAAVTQVKAHQVVTALPTTGIEENVEYVVVDNANKVTGTWVYDPAKGWLQTEKLDKPAHIVVKTLPTTNIDDEAEYVVVDDLTDPVNTFKATYVHTASGWVKTGESMSATAAHIAVTALPTTNINENAEYLVMTNTSNPSTLTGTWVRVNGNWVQTEKMEEGYHIVTSLPTSNIDDKNEYIVVEDLAKPDETLVGHYAYDKATNKWISLSSKYEVYRGLSINGYTTNADDFQDSPVGNVISYFGNDVPAHYLACDGASYNIGTHPELEAFFVEQFGAVNHFGGNGTTTWAVPDLRGEFLRGTGTNSHTNPTLNKLEGSGANVGDHQPASITSSIYSTPGDTSLEIGLGQTPWSYRTMTQEALFDMVLPTGVMNYIPGNITRKYSVDVDGGVGTVKTTNTSVKYCIKAESTYAIIPNSDYKVTSKLVFNTKINSNAQYRSGSITASEDDTSMVSGNAIIAPVDGYYDVSLRIDFTAAPTANGYVTAVVFKNYTPTNATFETWRPHTVAWDSQTTPGSAWSGVKVVASATVKLKKGDKLTCACGGSFGSSNPTGDITVALTNPISKTEVSRAEMMLKPNTWTPGVEQNFGDGVYGKRIKGTLTLALTIPTSGSASFGVSGVKSIINQGGIAARGDTDYVGMSVGGAFSEFNAAVWLNKNNKDLELWLARPVDISGTSTLPSTYSSTVAYDAWVLYTK